MRATGLGLHRGCFETYVSVRSAIMIAALGCAASCYEALCWIWLDYTW